MTKEFPMTNAEFSLITRTSGGESRGLPSRRHRGFHQLATLCWERNWSLGILVIHWSLRHWSLVICSEREPTGNVEEPDRLPAQPLWIMRRGVEGSVGLK